MQSQDVVVALKLALVRSWPGVARLSESVGMSLSQVHRSLQRLSESRLYLESEKAIQRFHLVQFLVNGLPYVFPARLREVVRGIPTAWASPALQATPLGAITPDALPPVWPDPEGVVKGPAVKPLHAAVPRVVQTDSDLYALLALVDALRVGRVRERQMAEAEIQKRLQDDSS